MEIKELVKNINKNEEKKEENLSLFSLNNREFVFDFRKGILHLTWILNLVLLIIYLYVFIK